ncbi:ammonia-forming cytochrome c nitrite reductase subunit c552 [Tissierella sp. Yu-01]|uniref:ammonia-forming cytochrome c nitrite reductase subunit c552 n=1 Tax=Tissierella sp. Yu-01 TaxID=3035694 RepID=UPI00240DFDF7|nr:ammonia-forming cytochrome c nitrite reductase subunit c552 [Tissierella sp. Yu-01]WFA07806.1 ammonia-forming cytochrome c nitrite reductase subunit c552 [Tissierella sp. Yu-01]
MRRKKLILSICFLLAIVLMISCTSKTPAPEPKPGPDTQPGGDVGEVEIPAPEDMIVDPKEWEEQFPQIYASYMKTSTMGDDTTEDSELGGSHPTDYLEKYPNIAILYEGIGFGKEYYEARGHFYALEDVSNISRPKGGASCLACKTAEYEKLYAEHGDQLASLDFQKTVQDVEFGITCYTCHRNTPGEGIQTTTLHFNDAADELNLQKTPGNLACSQCHVEYYFDKDDNSVILPWANGTEIAEIEEYYDEIEFSDWVHPRTGTPLIKVQHPETEMYTGSLHASMNVSCADCHMPRVTENEEEYKSHWVTSPLKTPNESCGRCHSDEIDNIVARVEAIQTEVEKMEVEVSDMLVKLIADFGQAIEDQKLSDEKIDQLRGLHRKAQYRWDFVFVENSTGFHNQAKATEALNEAKTYAQEALDILEGL